MLVRRGEIREVSTFSVSGTHGLTPVFADQISVCELFPSNPLPFSMPEGNKMRIVH